MTTPDFHCPLCHRIVRMLSCGEIERHSAEERRMYPCFASRMYAYAAGEIAEAVAYELIDEPPRFAGDIAHEVRKRTGYPSEANWCALLGLERRGEAVRSYGPGVMFAEIKR